MIRNLLLAILGTLLFLPVPAPARDAAGYWRGTLKVSEQVSLRIGVHIEREADGSLGGSLDSPDQNAFGLPIAHLVQGEDTLSFTMTAPAAGYSARWDPSAEAWSGTWQQDGASWPLVLSAGEPFRPASAPPLPAGWKIPAAAEIAALAEQRIAQRMGAGMVVGVIDPRGRRIVARGPAGGKPFDGDTEFEIGSMSKVFTALILADMALKHEVSLDDPVQKYLPAGARMPSRNGKVITLRMLAMQYSGLPRLPDNMPMKDPLDPYADYSEADLLAFLGHYELTRDPGSAYEYSNLGYGLLGYVLARAAHTDYATLLRQRITGPLGMKDTVIGLTPGQTMRFAAAYDAYMRPAKPWHMPVLAGAGAIRSTTNDMLTFLAAALSPNSRIGRQVALTLAERRRYNPQVQMALGWSILDAPGGEVATKDGGTGGFRSDMALQPATGRAVVVLTNSAVEPSASDIALHALIGSPVADARPVPPAPPRPSHRGEVALTSAQLDRVVGTYQLSPALQIVVRRDHDHLTAQVTGQPAVQIYAESPLSFFWKVVDAQIRFVARDDAVTGAIFQQNGATIEAKKVAE
jgi:CubicO group peptidase (beta-lactamase class C family)